MKILHYAEMTQQRRHQVYLGIQGTQLALFYSLQFIDSLYFNFRTTERLTPNFSSKKTIYVVIFFFVDTPRFETMGTHETPKNNRNNNQNLWLKLVLLFKFFLSYAY